MLGKALVNACQVELVPKSHQARFAQAITIAIALKSDWCRLQALQNVPGRFARIISSSSGLPSGLGHSASGASSGHSAAVSDQRPSNRVDISYLHYLPFADIFVSGDKLHRTAAPLFMDERQRFVWGPDLKADLAALNKHFSGLPEDEKAKGLFTLANKPPVEHQGLVSTLWDLRMPGWRTPKRAPPIMSPEEEAKIIASSRHLTEVAMKGGQTSFAGQEDVEHMIIQRHISKQRGSWRMFSEKVEAESDAEWELERDRRPDG